MRIEGLLREQFADWRFARAIFLYSIKSDRMNFSIS